MGEIGRVHIVDADTRRRAQIANQLYARGFHAEIYESVDELLRQPPAKGALLLNDDEDNAELDVTLQAIHERTAYLPIAMFSTHPSPRKIVKAVESGAMDYLAWPCANDDLAGLVRRLATEGEKKAQIHRRRHEAERLVQQLTPRERDVLVGLVDGGSNKHIAQQLGISPRTVEIHRGNMMARLNARSVSEAVRIGLYAGLGQ